MTKLTVPTTDRMPASITEAQAQVSRYATDRNQARLDLDSAQTAYNGAADADADAVEAAIEAGRSVPSKLPSVAMRATLDAAEHRLRAVETLHGRAVEKLAETYRTEARTWDAAEREVADHAEAECLAALAELVETFDRAKEARAVADWVASTRTGHPQPFTGAVRPDGSEMFRQRTENALGIPHRRQAEQWQRTKRERAEREAAAERTEIEKRAEARRRQADHEAGEERQRGNYLAALEAGGVPVPVRTPEAPVGLSRQSLAALDELVDTSERDAATMAALFGEVYGGDRA